MKILNLHYLEADDQLIFPENYQNLTLDSSALEVFTDFTKTRPLVIDGNTSVDEAEHLMIKAHVKLKLVVNSESHLVGLVSFAELAQDRVLPLVANGSKREDISVKDMMIHRADIQAIEYNDLEKASIGDVVETLQKKHVQHCLVVDKNTHAIRGLLSASDLARKLGLPILITAAPLFVDIFQALPIEKKCSDGSAL